MKAREISAVKYIQRYRATTYKGYQLRLTPEGFVINGLHHYYVEPASSSQTYTFFIPETQSIVLLYCNKHTMPDLAEFVRQEQDKVDCLEFMGDTDANGTWSLTVMSITMGLVSPNVDSLCIDIPAEFDKYKGITGTTPCPNCSDTPHPGEEVLFQYRTVCGVCHGKCFI